MKKSRTNINNIVIEALRKSSRLLKAKLDRIDFYSKIELDRIRDKFLEQNNLLISLLEGDVTIKTHKESFNEETQVRTTEVSDFVEEYIDMEVA